MGFHVDYDGLDQLYSDLYSNVSAWNSSLVTLSGNVKGLVSSSNMAGNGADSVKSYFDSMHNTIIPVMSRLITAHANNCLLYIRNYQSGIDTSLHAVMDEDELEQTKRLLSVQFGFAEEINANVQRTLGLVSDIIYVSCPGFDVISDNNKEIKTLIEKLLTDIKTLEDTHYQNDFIDTSQLIATLKAFITEHLSDSRSYKANFSVEPFAQSSSFIALAQAYVAVNAQIEANQDAVLQAIKDENNRIDELTAEVEARQKEANTEKWVVTGLCVVGSIVAIAVIVGTGGAATPLVVGTVSAVSGAVIAGNNAAADEYVAHGWDTGKWDMGSIGTSAVLGGVSGFITGYVGAGVSSVLTDGLSAAGSTLLNSSSMAVRVGSNAVIGSTSQVISGVATRGTATFVTTMIASGGDVSTSVDAAWEYATNGQQILIDAAIGGVAGGIKGIKKPTTVQTTHREKIVDQDKRIDAVSEDIKNGSGEVISQEKADYIQKSIWDYTDDSTDIRSAYNNPDSPYREQMEALDDYINNSPKWKGTTMRGINVTAETAEGFLSGEEIDMLGPSSWSTSEEVAQNFAKDSCGRSGTRTNVVFVLDENQSGTSITHLSTFGTLEAEVLAPSGVKYAMDSFEEVKDHFINYLYIYVHEVH